MGESREGQGEDASLAWILLIYRKTKPGPIPIGEARPIAKQMAAALEAFLWLGLEGEGPRRCRVQLLQLVRRRFQVVSR